MSKKQVLVEGHKRTPPGTVPAKGPKPGPKTVDVAGHKRDYPSKK